MRIQNRPKSALRDWLVRLLHPDRLPLYYHLPLLLTILIECLARHSVWEGIAFAFRNPIGFAVSVCIISLTLHPALLCPKRVPLIALISTVWLGLGVTEFILMFNRVTPLSAVDFAIVPSVITIMNVYLSVPAMIGIAVLLLSAVGGIVLLFIKTRSRAVLWKKSLVSAGICAAALVLSLLIGFSIGSLSDSFPNPSEAYDRYGFTFCFTMSLVDRGVDKPDNYNEGAITDILSEIGEPDDAESSSPDGSDEEQLPNVIIVQLESFFDVHNLSGVTFTQEPMPCFTSLASAWPSGSFTVPVIGAGTVNTEFEVLTGMRINDFGAGEYPYRTVMANSTCETVAYDLLAAGLRTHAIHDHEGTFYDRHLVYTHMGFESFTPIEYFLHPETNINGWAKDAVLTDEILDILASTEAHDLVFAVSVQGHGAYPTDYTPAAGDVAVAGGVTDPDDVSRLNYYLSQLHDMDAFVGALTEAVMSLDEKTVLLFYGDHQPSLSQDDCYTLSCSDFETCWLCVSNYDADLSVLSPDGTGRSLYAFQTFPLLMQVIGCDEGIVNRFHRSAIGTESYLEDLEALEYDALYGEKYALGGREYPVMSMTLGHRPVVITGVEEDGDTVIVHGDRFTPYSSVAIGLRTVETEYIDEHTLRFRRTRFTGLTSPITVRQRTVLGEELGESAPFLLPKESENQ